MASFTIRKGLVLIVRISKAEKTALVEKYPDIACEVTRALRRPNYYAPEYPKVIAFLKHWENSKTKESWCND